MSVSPCPNETTTPVAQANAAEDIERRRDDRPCLALRAGSRTENRPQGTRRKWGSRPPADPRRLNRFTGRSTATSRSPGSAMPLVSAPRTDESRPSMKTNSPYPAPEHFATNLDDPEPQPELPPTFLFWSRRANYKPIGGRQNRADRPRNSFRTARSGRPALAGTLTASVALGPGPRPGCCFVLGSRPTRRRPVRPATTASTTNPGP